MEHPKYDKTYDDLEIGEEQVTSNECWEEEDPGITEPVYPDLNLAEEQVTSNECYDPEEE